MGEVGKIIQANLKNFENPLHTERIVGTKIVSVSLQKGRTQQQLECQTFNSELIDCRQETQNTPRNCDTDGGASIFDYMQKLKLTLHPPDTTRTAEFVEAGSISERLGARLSVSRALNALLYYSPFPQSQQVWMGTQSVADSWSRVDVHENLIIPRQGYFHGPQRPHLLWGSVCSQLVTTPDRRSPTRCIVLL